MPLARRAPARMRAAGRADSFRCQCAANEGYPRGATSSRQTIESRGQIIDFDRDRDVDVVRGTPAKVEETAKSRRSDEHERRVGPELAQISQCSDLSRGERHLAGSRYFRYFTRTSSAASAARSDGRVSSSA